MLVYITAIGSGHSAKIPLQNNKKYSGVLGIVERTKQFGTTYKNQEIEQDTLFDLLYKDAEFDIIQKCIIQSDDNIYHKGKALLDNIDNIVTKYPKAKFHIELSQGYKELAHILSLIGRMRYKFIDSITFLRYDKSLMKFPNSEFSISKDKYVVLQGFYEGTKDSQFNGKIATNKFMYSSTKHRKYIYAVLKWGKEQGLIADNNYFTDFGRLALEYCK